MEEPEGEGCLAGDVLSRSETGVGVGGGGFGGSDLDLLRAIKSQLTIHSYLRGEHAG